MSDNPERSVRWMRRQLEMIRDFDQDFIESLVDCQTKEEMIELGIEESDAERLDRMTRNKRTDMESLFQVDEEDAEALLQMSNKIQLLGESKCSIQRHEFHLRRNLTIAKDVGGLAEALEDRKAAEKIVRWINTEKNNSRETNKDYRVAFRMFGKYATEGEGKPESIEWVPGGYPKNYDPAPNPAKMYRWEDHILPMIDACNNSRDRALIALDWDLGPRPTELYDLERGSFTDHKYGLKVTIEHGKRGTRSPVITTSVPYIQQWRQDHPAPDDPDAPLWTRLTRPEPISENRIRDIFKEKAKAADMTPPSTPTPLRMRKSSASYLASQNVSQSHLEDHHGWKRGSDQAARYIAVFSEANDREIAEAHGVEINESDTPNRTAPVTCPRCNRETPRDEQFCIWCSQAITPEATERLQEQEEKVRHATLKLTQEQPDVREKIKRAEQLMTLFEENPELQEEIQKLTQSLEGGG